MDIAALIDALGGTTTVARVCGTAPPVVSNWKARGSIPPGYWAALEAHARIAGAKGITFESLARLHAKPEPAEARA